jgi:hypothetical protein
MIWDGFIPGAGLISRNTPCQPGGENNGSIKYDIDRNFNSRIPDSSRCGDVLEDEQTG